jgi:hypothetical protein
VALHRMICRIFPRGLQVRSTHQKVPQNRSRKPFQRDEIPSTSIPAYSLYRYIKVRQSVSRKNAAVKRCNISFLRFQLRCHRDSGSSVGHFRLGQDQHANQGSLQQIPSPPGSARSAQGKARSTLAVAGRWKSLLRCGRRMSNGLTG